MKVGGLTLIFHVCIIHFPVVCGPDKFGLKKGLPVDQKAILRQAIYGISRITGQLDII